MNHAIILAGGIGSRMKLNHPKQYLEVKGKPVFMYSFEKFANHPDISSIVMVISEEWKDYVQDCIDKSGCKKPVYYADAGQSRQHSVLNGLKALSGIADNNDLVFVHDSVRPLFPLSNIDDAVKECEKYDATLPVIPVKDATYQSRDGKTLSSMLPREELFSGQSPECFNYGSYLRLHDYLTDDEIGRIRGGSELAFKSGMKVCLIPGTEQNFKITTIEDLRAFELTLEKI